MLDLKRVGVTGGIASGKTTVCQIFEELGAYVVSADEIVHHLLIPETDLGQKVEKLMGSECVIEGQFCKDRISEKVFRNADLLTSLEQILHPKVRETIEKEAAKAALQIPKPTLFVAEVPLLFEAGFEPLFDEVIVVIADEKTSQNRYEKSKGQDFFLRSKRHFSPEEKVQRAQIVINNRGSLEDLRKEVIHVFSQLV